MDKTLGVLTSNSVNYDKHEQITGGDNSTMHTECSQNLGTGCQI